MKVAHRLASLAYLVGWVGLLIGGPDARAVVVLLMAYLLTRRNGPELQLFGGLLLTASLVSDQPVWGISFGIISLGAGWLAKPARRSTDLENAVIWVAVLLSVLFVVVFLTPRPESPIHLPLALAAGWWMTARFARSAHGFSLFPKATLPVFLAVVLLAVGFLTGQSQRGRAEQVAERLVASAHKEQDPDQVSSLLKRATKVYPWRPLVWKEIGDLALSDGRPEAAFTAFKRGSSVRADSANPCLRALLETATVLGRWRFIARLVNESVLPMKLIRDKAISPVAVELWKSGNANLAFDLFNAKDSLATDEQEFCGWLAQEVGENRIALDLLTPLVSSGEASGETMYRSAMALHSMGEENLAAEILSSGIIRHPRHMGLSRAQGIELAEGCRRMIGPKGKGIPLGNTVLLLGWDASPDPCHPGDTLTVCLAWAAIKPLRDMVVILHLDHGSPVRWRLNADHAPLGGNFSTSSWPVGEMVVDVTEVAIPEDAPKGSVRLLTGLWIPGDQESRLLPGPRNAHLIPRGEKRIPIGQVRIANSR